MKTKFESIATLCLLLASITYFMSHAFTLVTKASNIIFVDTAVIGGNGTNWASAFDDLQDALDIASAGDEIWVATGTYTPSIAVDSDPRSITFQLIDGLAIYGGFPTGGGDGTFNARNSDQFITILSGDLNDDDVGFTNNDENSYHVVIGSNTEEATLLDGFTITGGNANDVCCGPHTFGGGMYIDSGSPTIKNIIFAWNYAGREGGGLHTRYSSSPLITNTIFLHNYADYRGGGMSNGMSNPTVVNSQFISNTANAGAGGMGNYYNYTAPSPIIIGTIFSQNYGRGMENDNSHPVVIDSIFSENNGGGMYNYFSNPTISNTIFVSNTAYSGAALYILFGEFRLINSTIIANQASTDGGGIFHPSHEDNRNSIVHNTIIWNNSANGNTDESAQIYDEDNFPVEVSYSLIQNWESGGVGNINSNPLFVREPSGTDYGDLRLQPMSPAIDAGSNENCTEKDYRHINRPVDGNQDTIPVCDLGAFEFFEPFFSVADTTVFEDMNNHVTATFTITLSFSPIITAHATYTTTSGTAVAHADFLPISGELTFAPGEISNTVSVQILSDTTPEAEEVFYLSLNNVENAFIEDGTATGTIIDNNKKIFLPLAISP